MFYKIVLFWFLSLNLFSKANIPDPDTYWTYKSVAGKDLKLSVFLPENYEAGKKFPTIAIFHGGSWRVGNPNMHYADCKYWASRGMIAVSVKYRLKDEDKITVPFECMKDAKSAIRYLRKNASQLKVNSEKIVVAGGSAGAQLAASTAMIPKVNDEVYDLAISAKPQAIILYNPWFKCKKEWSPTHNVVADLPPMIIFSGGNDKAIPVQEMVDFHKSMKAQSNKTELYIGQDGKHGFCNGRNPNNPFFYWSIKHADDFLVKAGILSGQATIQYPQRVKAISKERVSYYP
ncbi:probable lipase/esterase [Lentisphaera araneosa HTCC2155]|uniref:Probable lipase/esterase n=1 Tax=Lentisphaera araneosa HTCC2155 TaxID=313628 RepID=A6DGN9_9BACT|nr:alpha/beta hydrolase [Lentisphaera araneosa]EDM29356.1 probable lipase/esterase [Lentisphaera araneosa HTCC2155]